jgi:hypothetical protein
MKSCRTIVRIQKQVLRSAQDDTLMRVLRSAQVTPCLILSIYPRTDTPEKERTARPRTG